MSLRPPATPRTEPVRAWKRAQVLLPLEGDGVRFTGTVRADLPYRSDDVFCCERGHRFLDPQCSCGFYALEDRARLPPSLVTTAVLEVDLEGLVVRHETCLRAERQRIRAVTFDGWCSYCTEAAAALAGVRSLWGELPPGWLRAVPVCAGHAGLFTVVMTTRQLALAGEVPVGWDRATESRASRSLRRLHRSGASLGHPPAGSRDP